jgi:hypothetical protein
MEQCLIKLWPTGHKDILEAATSSVYYLPPSPYSQLWQQILLEFSKTTWKI